MTDFASHDFAFLQGRRILVVGDVMLDRWITGHSTRKSPEADCIVFTVEQERDALGAAANVTANIASLGGRPHLIGLCGADAASETISSKLAAIHDASYTLVRDITRCTTVKKRVIRSENTTHIVRLDKEVCCPPTSSALHELIARVTVALVAAEAVIFSDYGKGIFQEELFDAIRTGAKEAGIPLLVDPTSLDFSRYQGAAIITPNLQELSAAVGYPLNPEQTTIERAARAITEQTAVPAVCVTLGQFGVQLVEDGRTIARYPSHASKVIDVSGAGDTLISVLAMSLAAGEQHARAVDIANIAASLAVQKLNTATITAAELAHAMNSNTAPEDEIVELDQDVLASKVALWQNEGLRIGFTNGCFDLIHPGHIRVLKQARQRVDRLVVALNSDQCVRRLKGPGRPIQDEASRLEVIAALDAVDVVTLFDDDTPFELIKSLQPECLFKGGDYKIDEVVGRDVVQARGGNVEIIQAVEGQSTTMIIEKSRRDSAKALSKSVACPVERDIECQGSEPMEHKTLHNEVAKQVSCLVQWLKDVVWPYWLEHGADRDAQGKFIGFREHLNIDRTGCSSDHRRLLTSSRQIYVFSHAAAAGLIGAKEIVLDALGHLRAVARQFDGGYARTFDLEGQILDHRQDLYDTAFVLLAFSAAMSAMPSDALKSDALALDRHLQENFAHKDGGYIESLPPSMLRRQNSHMHLLEAYLAAAESFGPSTFLDRADALVELFHTRLWQPRDRAVPENLDGDWVPCRTDGRYILEPGHLASWCCLLEWHHDLTKFYEREVRFEHRNLARQLLSFINEYSLEPSSYAVVNMVSSVGSFIDHGQRLWPQLEKFKAELLYDDSKYEKTLRAIDIIRKFVDDAPAGLWIERRGHMVDDGIVPATSLYHITNAIMFATSRLNMKSAWKPVPKPARPLTVRKSILITGGAGFIGSNLVMALNAAGYSNVIVCDEFGQDGKWQNLCHATIDDIVHPRDLFEWLDTHQDIEAILHFGAVSSTTSTDADQAIDVNFRLSLHLLDWCAAHEVKLIYASSAATYGSGDAGYSDDISSSYLRTLKPLNLYGWTKHLFDQLVSRRYEAQESLPPLCVGLKLFNVFGPNESHKGHMRSLISKNFTKIKRGETIDLFRSHRPDYQDGCQRRDFVYVRDVARVVLWLLSRENGVSLYNVGSGDSHTFQDFVGAVFDNLGIDRRIRYVDMPKDIRANYQYHTQADLSSLRQDGYDQPMTKLEDAVSDFVHKEFDFEIL